MASVKKRTFSLTSEQSDFVDRKVAAGEYASSSEVIRDGLRAMQERDAAIERWLREEVVPTIRKYEADPSKGIPLDEAFDRIEAKLIARMKAAE